MNRTAPGVTVMVSLGAVSSFGWRGTHCEIQHDRPGAPTGCIHSRDQDADLRRNTIVGFAGGSILS